MEQAKGADRARLDAQAARESGGGGQAETGCPDAFAQLAQLDGGGGFEDGEIMAVAFLVAQEKVLAVGAGQAAVVLAGLPDGVDGGMFAESVGDGEGGEGGLDLLLEGHEKI
jgi:hypothetical protein